MFDEIWWEADLPAGHSPDSRLFQTKSFENCFDRFVVTPEGRFCLVGNGWQDDDPFRGEKTRGSIDMEFHGDMRLSSLVDGKYVEYVARFTHGTLEWIRPSADVPQILRNLPPPESPPE
jgi:hypothetical protein